MKTTNVILWGGTGQSKVIRPLVESLPNHKVVAVFDDTEDLSPPFSDIPLYCGWGDFTEWVTTNPNCKFVVTIGNPHSIARRTISSKLILYGLNPLTVMGPYVSIGPNTSIGVGAQIHPGVIINPSVSIGDYCIINTRALIEHDDILESGVEVGPGAILCGEVQVGENTWIGAGATVKDKIIIGKNCIVGAGAVVVKDVPDNSVVVGNPAKFLKSTTTSSGNHKGWDSTVYYNYENLPPTKSLLSDSWVTKESQRLPLTPQELKLVKDRNQLLLEYIKKGNSILDFGGSLGFSYLSCEDTTLDYHIVETQSICKEGVKLYKGNVKFYSVIPTDLKLDILYVRTALQYAKDWVFTLKQLLENQPKLLIFNHLSAGDIPTFICFQEWQDQQIPYWFINLKEFKEIIGDKYELIREERGDKIETNFKSGFNVKYSVNLVFKNKNNYGQ